MGDGKDSHCVKDKVKKEATIVIVLVESRNDCQTMVASGHAGSVRKITMRSTANHNSVKHKEVE